MTSYELWQLERYGNYLPDSEPALEDERHLIEIPEPNDPKDDE